MRRKTLLFTAPLLILTLLLAACGGASFATQLQVILAASGPLISSLPLPANIKSGLITDFTDLSSGAVSLANTIGSCKSDKVCALQGVSTFEALFETVDARGNFGKHPKLVTIEGIIKGIIASAEIYYGGQPKASKAAAIGRASTSNAPARTVTEAQIKAQVETLKAAMQP